MSRPFMPWYIGDYLRDTGHLTTEQHGAYLLLLAHCWQHERIPASAGERAAIAKLTPGRWKAIGGPVERFFEADGSQKRVTAEIERTERKIAQRIIAGKSGGVRSGIARAAKRGASEKEAESKRDRSERFTTAQAKPQAETKQPRTNQNQKELSSSAGGVVGEKIEDQNPAGLLATAHPTGALARPPATEPVASTDIRISPERARLEARHWLKRPADFKSPPICPCCFGWKFTPLRKTA